MVSKALNLALRGFQFFCALIVMALVGNMIATAVAGNSAMVNYDMFVAVFGMASLLYLLPTAFLDSFSAPMVNIALDALNVLFWFCGAVATAAYLHVHSCSNLGYTRSNHITNGSPDTKKRCHEAQASTAFLWFGWAAFTASLIISAMGGSGTMNMRSPMRRSGPSMSQV
ncbi:marvel domain-containing protein [Clohesyomyces aquaticus]|uniref:Marvel domain-containing protein n=1 Tax=Clohesyomyces aquaticus TaxID=1231657 RepID=A0A1Y1Z0P5_9PLEO|nr:marvel domain-containing protein [Clohesyomyces aquaticus]